ncbi:IclR family transcriptional regulator [Paracidovorax avenae]|uniref:IclR family transcriptional regulator n=1 Tax=Paracidovorax avenae TaxID=80867 RepID=UPI000D1576CF|nr:helix-turn-helix domain-containing protein [Paracidovorax avenae]AVS71274.1 IclR family transcriptional regulator [Paracidovorax avenae]AVS94250.1 IclR family transcriptional regulator [Paracidovorax avenae]AVT20988.1 IclR family transcriptional regulator [Paracidovorax avenae]
MDIARSAILPDKPGRSPANRSLERGMEVLRAFRPGSELLGNGELAERTGLSKATVSRLTQTLVGAGMLQLDVQQRAYRLAPAVLSLAHAMRSGSSVLAAAAPAMRALAESRRINVGLAAPDRDEMVYLESIRYSRRIVLRHVVSGQRVPMELTSLGRAYLAVAPEARRKALLRSFRQRRGPQPWAPIARAIEEARASVRGHGFCAAAWQPEVVALATPMVLGPDAIYVLNVSASTAEPLQAVVEELHAPLLALRDEVLRALA